MGQNQDKDKDEDKDSDNEEKKPWYKTTTGIMMIILGILVLLGIVFFVIYKSKGNSEDKLASAANDMEGSY